MSEDQKDPVLEQAWNDLVDRARRARLAAEALERAVLSRASLGSISGEIQSIVSQGLHATRLYGEICGRTRKLDG